MIITTSIFKLYIMFHSIDIPQLVNQSPITEHVGCFQVFTVKNNVEMKFFCLKV